MYGAFMASSNEPILHKKGSVLVGGGGFFPGTCSCPLKSTAVILGQIQLAKEVCVPPPPPTLLEWSPKTNAARQQKIGKM